MKNTDNRSPEEIESDLERTRADFTSTIDAIQHKLSPSEMMDNAVDYALSTTPGAFSMNLVNSVRDNPIPVALIGIGIAWLMAAGRQTPAYEPGRRYARSVRRPRYAADYEGYEGYDENEYLAARDYGAGEPEEGMMQRMSSKAGEAGSSIKDTASNVGQRISDTASSVTGRVQQAGQSARQRLQETAGSAQARMSEMRRRSQMQAGYAKDRFNEMYDEQPLAMGAVGLAIGAVLGAVLPSTRRENEMMGSMRDDLMHRAKETAREQADTLKQSAQRVAETAKKEAERVAEDMSNRPTTQQPTAGAGQGTSATTGTTTGSATPYSGPTGSSSIH
ncbi:DUF3618 domain-containing protein [Noviherbaspirillum sp.]|uniref:DUF3618 domain-containing protein n=1 Tax=Noviherbaspirillum sp. TaxID=1926288 RepID=UPI002D5528A5|nr:DUF3618 domain-containing protein [Noviherbaspirillum sp.]HZW21274.1 DUF3618 domain-containing protein [Noviherbaspirillum sp.]